MKIAISIPDKVFARAEQLARSKGFTLSELITEALRFYLQHQAATDAEKVHRVDELVAELDEKAFASSDLSRAQLNSLEDEGW